MLSPAPTRTPSAHLASGLGPDPAAQSTRRLTERMPEDHSRHLPEPQRPPTAAAPREGAELGPFASAQLGSPARSIDLGGRETSTPQAWGGGQSWSRREAGMRRGGGEAKE